MMNEIVKARYILYLLAEIDDINLYDLKKETIEQSNCQFFEVRHNVLF